MVFSGSTFASSVCSPVAPNAGVQSKFSVCVAPMARLLMVFVPRLFAPSNSSTSMLVAAASPWLSMVTFTCCFISV